MMLSNKIGNTHCPTSFNCHNIKQFLSMAFLGTFIFAFTIIIGSIVFANDTYDLTPVIVVALVCLNVGILYIANRFLHKHINFFERNWWVVITTGAIVLFIINIVFGFMLRYTPVFDLGAIFTGASEWAVTGNFMERMDPTCDSNYFYYFPNNLGGMTLLYFAFKIASLFGGTDYFAIAMITNAVLAAIMVLLTILICKRLFGIRQSVMALTCILFMPTSYFIAPTFYTDSLSVVFPVLVIYLYLRTIGSKTLASKIFFSIMIGVACAIGMLIKFTVMISLIAVVIYHCIRKGVVSALSIAAISVSVIIGVFALFNGYFYSNHLEKATAQSLNTPYTHWIMMSLEGEGRYNPQDYEFTRSFDDIEERDSAISSEITRRIGEKGVMGMLELFKKKGIISFGDGTLAQSDFLDDTPAHSTFLHRFVLYDSEYHGVYKYACAGIFYALLLLMLIAALGSLYAKQQCDAMLPMLCVFGIMLFLMFWEATGRYITNYVPMIIISAVYGLDLICRERGKAALWMKGI